MVPWDCCKTKKLNGPGVASALLRWNLTPEHGRTGHPSFQTAVFSTYSKTGCPFFNLPNKFQFSYVFVFMSSFSSTFILFWFRTERPKRLMGWNPGSGGADRRPFCGTGATGRKLGAGPPHMAVTNGKKQPKQLQQNGMG